ncbi:MAG: YraN family protein [Sebaldella sp.]|nr:YraN family protein [Sebaldella sp.]
MSMRGIGFKYENLAKNFLLNKKMKYLESNYYSKYGEIDLIFKKGDILIFVEVKYRKNDVHGLAEESVSEKKLNRIINTSLIYIAENNWTGEYRYDLIAINGEEIVWFENII